MRYDELLERIQLLLDPGVGEERALTELRVLRGQVVEAGTEQDEVRLRFMDGSRVDLAGYGYDPDGGDTHERGAPVTTKELNLVWRQTQQKMLAGLRKLYEDHVLEYGVVPRIPTRELRIPVDLSWNDRQVDTPQEWGPRRKVEVVLEPGTWLVTVGADGMAVSERRDP